MPKKSINWSEKDKFSLCVSILVAISSGLLSGTVVSSVNEFLKKSKFQHNNCV